MFFFSRASLEKHHRYHRQLMEEIGVEAGGMIVWSSLELEHFGTHLSPGVGGMTTTHQQIGVTIVRFCWAH